MLQTRTATDPGQRVWYMSLIQHSTKSSLCQLSLPLNESQQVHSCFKIFEKLREITPRLRRRHLQHRSIRLFIRAKRNIRDTSTNHPECYKICIEREDYQSHIASDANS